MVADFSMLLVNEVVYLKITDLVEVKEISTVHEASFLLYVNEVNESGNFVKNLEVICCRYGSTVVETIERKMLETPLSVELVRDLNVPLGQR